MGQTVVDEDVSRKGKHLRLVLQPAEGRREDQPIVVALKIGALVLPLVIGLHAEAFAR